MSNNFSLTTLQVNVTNIVKNYQRVVNIVGNKVNVAAVVKANCYGLGMMQIVPALEQEGCREFYVATLDEAISLRQLLKQDADIFVLLGVNKSEEEYFLQHNLIPVLNNQHQMQIWGDKARALGKKLLAALHVDTGMTRLGIPDNQFSEVLSASGAVDLFNISYIISHLACPGICDHPMNETQLNKFKQIRQSYPKYRYSFSSSAGVLLGQEYIFDQVRPGACLYGINVSEDQVLPLQPVVALTSRIIQVYRITNVQSVGYSASYQLEPGMVTATIPVGYADGYFRCLSNKGYCYIADIKVPIIGAVSMDVLSIDVTHVPEHLRQIGQKVELIGNNVSVETIASIANTIGYEVLTSIGNRYYKEYV